MIKTQKVEYASLGVVSPNTSCCYKTKTLSYKFESDRDFYKDVIHGAKHVQKHLKSQLYKSALSDHELNMPSNEWSLWDFTKTILSSKHLDCRQRIIENQLTEKKLFVKNMRNQNILKRYQILAFLESVILKLRKKKPELISFFFFVNEYI